MEEESMQRKEVRAEEERIQRKNSEIEDLILYHKGSSEHPYEESSESGHGRQELSPGLELQRGKTNSLSQSRYQQ